MQTRIDEKLVHQAIDIVVSRTSNLNYYPSEDIEVIRDELIQLSNQYPFLRFLKSVKWRLEDNIAVIEVYKKSDSALLEYMQSAIDKIATLRQEYVESTLENLQARVRVVEGENEKLHQLLQTMMLELKAGKDAINKNVEPSKLHKMFQRK